MRYAGVLALALLVSACGDDTNGTLQTAGKGGSHAHAGKGGSDGNAGKGGSGGAPVDGGADVEPASKLDRPGTLPRPPKSGLPADLRPPR